MATKQTKSTYSIITGLVKTVKNGAILFAPAIVAFLTNVPQEYAVPAGFGLYFVKNYLQNRSN